MKHFLIAFFLLITIGTRAQKTDSLIAKSSENLPDKSITEKYPLFFATIKQMQIEEPKLSKVYYGRFNSNSVIKVTNYIKGVIIVDIDYLERNESNYDNLSTWYFLCSLGVIDYGYSKKNIEPFELNKSKYYYALDKSSKLAEIKKDCGVLKVGINNIKAASMSSKDMNIKMAAEEVKKSDLFASKSEILSKCLGGNSTDSKPIIKEQIKETYKAPTPDPVNETSATPEVPKKKEGSNEERIKKALKKLSQNVDEFTNKAYYYDSRVDPHHLTGDGLFATINDDNKQMKLVIYHQGMAALINEIQVKAGEKIYKFKGDKMKKNGSTFSFLSVTGTTNDQTSYTYKILKSIVESGKCMIRFDTQFGRIDDYTLSNREIKEIATVVEAYEALNDL